MEQNKTSMIQVSRSVKIHTLPSPTAQRNIVQIHRLESLRSSYFSCKIEVLLWLHNHIIHNTN